MGFVGLNIDTYMSIQLHQIGQSIPLMSFDVESCGLHGEGFAVGYVVIWRGEEVESGCFASPLHMASGYAEDREWVKDNVPEIASESPDTFTVREKFWKKWMFWKNNGAVLAADCGWPVESRFLSLCVDELQNDRKWDGPYPLIEISSILLSAGIDPLGQFDRLESEIPKHDPVCDARQSARLMMEAIKKLVDLHQKAVNVA